MNITDLITNFATNLWDVVLEAAPWLLIGLIAAGLIKALVPTDWMTRWLGGRGIGSIVRAAFIGTPLPLCSCGVLPAAMGLHRSGASKGATVSFLVATPENGADSIAMSYALLGPFMMIVRPIAGLASAILAGVLAEAVGVREKKEEAQPQAASSCCCSHEKAPAEPVKSCCSHEANETPAKPAWPKRVVAGLHYAMTRIIDDISLWLVIGLVAAAAIRAFVPESFLAEWGAGWTGMFVMLIVGLPMYICATASTPVAGSLLLAGVSPGAVLVFLLAGPATNIGSIMVLRKELGTRTIAGYLAGVILGALAFGFATNLIARSWDMHIAAQVGHTHEMTPQWLAIACAAVLIFLAIPPLRGLILRPTTEARIGSEAVAH
ncbi:MAG: SO_0444 family Cu/Zn efflux transporter [Planctomycetes bacterium]|nr:SO_0444 family Cu/Zn efflux transporter [Planctomycetota bacterium]